MTADYRDETNGYTQVPGTNTGSLDLTIPTTVKAGDFALLFFAGDTPSAGLVEPSGWTRTKDPITSVGPASAEQSWCWKKTLTSADAGSTVSIGVTATDTRKMVGHFLAYSGVASVEAVDAVADVTTAHARTTPQLTGVTAGDVVVEFVCDRVGSNTGTWTVPSPMTDRGGTVDGGSLLLSVAADRLASPGTTVGGHVYTKSSAMDSPQGHAWTVALLPSTAGGSGTLRVVRRRLINGAWV